MRKGFFNKFIFFKSKHLEYLIYSAWGRSKKNLTLYCHTVHVFHPEQLALSIPASVDKALYIYASIYYISRSISHSPQSTEWWRWKKIITRLLFSFIFTLGLLECHQWGFICKTEKYNYSLKRKVVLWINESLWGYLHVISFWGEINWFLEVISPRPQNELSFMSKEPKWNFISGSRWYNFEKTAAIKAHISLRQTEVSAPIVCIGRLKIKQNETMKHKYNKKVYPANWEWAKKKCIKWNLQTDKHGKEVFRSSSFSTDNLIYLFISWK